jgi:hypothetical protein
MTICFQADADLNQAIVSGILRRDPSIDFQTANVSDLSGLTDLEVLLIAAQERFCWDIFADGMVVFSAFVGAICKSPLRRWWFDATILCTGLGMIIHSSK